jgi:CRP/FNR family transcriptional regulator, nitrogen fixation regulation protein
LHLQDA